MVIGRKGGYKEEMNETRYLLHLASGVQVTFMTSCVIRLGMDRRVDILGKQERQKGKIRET